jgi:hypothetical protein
LCDQFLRFYSRYWMEPSLSTLIDDAKVTSPGRGGFAAGSKFSTK